MTIGGTIHALRVEKRIPQKTVAQYLNVSVSTVSNYEVDRHLPDVITLAKIADMFNVSTDFILGRSKFRHGFHHATNLGFSDQHLERTDKLVDRFMKMTEEQRDNIFDSIHILINNYVNDEEYAE